MTKAFYLDINVLTAYKQNTELKSKIDTLSKEHLFLYSEAHLIELFKSWPSEEFINDVIVLEIITKGAYVYDNGENFSIKNYSPIQNVIENKEALRNIAFPDTEVAFKEDMFQYIEDSKLISELTKEQKDVFDSLLGDINEEIKATTFLEFIEGINKKITDLSYDIGKYKQFREKSIELSKLKIDVKWQPEEAIFKINEQLKNIGQETLFDNAIRVSGLVNKNVSRLRSFYESLFMNLDLLGYAKDTKNKKSPQNIFIDAQHSFYGSACSYLITNDKSMGIKTKAIVSAFDTGCKVLNDKEFLRESI